jgi:hypothetical protein
LHHTAKNTTRRPQFKIIKELHLSLIFWRCIAIPAKHKKRFMKKTKEQIKPARKIHTADTRERARKMYLRGLYLTEISVLLSVPLRTLEKWQTVEQWTALKELPEIKKRAFDLARAGKTHKEIAELLKINVVTVWRYIKAYKDNEKKQ